MRHGEMAHFGRNVLVTVQFAPAGMDLVDSARMRELRPLLALRTYRKSIRLPSWLATVNEAVIGLPIAAVVGKAAGLSKKSTV